MPRLLPGLVAATILAISSAISCKAGAATVPGVGSLSPVTKSYVPVEKVGYWRRQSVIAVAITVMATLIMATATINHTATTDPTRTMATVITDPILIMGMATAGATRLAARRPQERLITGIAMKKPRAGGPECGAIVASLPT